MKLGIIGTGRIAERFALEAHREEYAKRLVISCVYNPHIDSASLFAASNKIAEYTDDLKRFNDKCDAVYIASPHGTHAQYVRIMLENGKNVLCEKPLALTKRESEELYELAARKGLVLIEAVKTAYCPGFMELVKKAKSGVIGKIRDVEASFTRLTLSNTREYTDSIYGGSFTEFGSYNMLPIFELLGADCRSVSFMSQKAENGVDVYTKALFEFENSFAAAKCGLAVKSEGQLLISGEKGYILAKSPWWLTKSFEVRFEDAGRIETYEYPFKRGGLSYELEAFITAANGQSDSTQKELLSRQREISIASAGVMEAFLKKRADERKDTYNAKVRFGEGSAECKKISAHVPAKDVKIWAHRGCSYLYPENTISAFKAAAKLPGITGIEMDVQLTRDGEVVVFHDENVSRLTRGKKDVRDYLLKEISKLKINAGGAGKAKSGKALGISKALSKSKVSSKLPDYEHIPTLDEFLTAMEPYCKQNGLMINIELKTSKYRYDRIEEKTLKLVKKHGLSKYIVYSSFLADSIELMKKLDPDCSTGMLAMTYSECRYRADGSPIYADALHPYIGGLTTQLPEDKRGITVRAWNGEEPFFTKDKRKLPNKDLREYAELGVTDIITNVPERYVGEENNL